MENNLEVCFYTKCNIEVEAGKGRVYCKNANGDNYNYFNIDDSGFNVILNPSADENDQVNFSIGGLGIRATKEFQPEDEFSYVQKMYVEKPQTLINTLTNCNSTQLEEIKTILGII